MSNSQHGVLIVNLGTPRSPSANDVKHYLREFLMDPRVISIPYFFRWILVNLIIAPFRGKKSGEKYKKIWTQRGSPLLFHSEDFKNKLQAKLDKDYKVALGMRYGTPNIQSALEELKNCQQIQFIPMFPQYADATSGSAISKLNEIQSKNKNDNISLSSIPIKIVESFYSDEFFIKSCVLKIEKTIHIKDFDQLVFSFHGLPKSQILKINGCFANGKCCEVPKPQCYVSQCYATARKIAQQMNLPKDFWTVSFQSRLGRGEWISPYTDETLIEMPKKNKKKIAVFCPSFVADCLETLEEIEMENKELYLGAGGQVFKMIPSLNSDDDWIQLFSEWIISRIDH